MVNTSCIMHTGDSMQYTYKNNSNKKSIRNHEDDEIDDKMGGLPLMMIDKKPYREFTQVYAANHIHYYISDVVGEPIDYVDMIHRIATAGPADVISIHLNTPGGVLDTGVQLINAMHNSQAKIVTSVEGSVKSLGTLIFLAGDEMIVNDNCMMMFHNFNGGLMGKGNELVSELEATIKWFATLARDIYIPFMTEDEFTRIARGEDMWMQSTEIRERLERVVQAQMDEAEAQLTEIEAAIELLEAEEPDDLGLTGDTDPDPVVPQFVKRKRNKKQG